jgi:metal-responsive CopG/Arc/MetJ family transcriptional regulator
VLRVNISIDEGLLKDIARAAAIEGRSRSEFFRRAAEAYLAQGEARERQRRGMAKAIKIQGEIRAKTNSWDAVSLIRKMRATGRS